METTEALIVGAGQAGLAMSHHLGRRGVEHVVLEQGRVGETWRSQRWDSFALNTPGWFSRLPGDDQGAGPADEFAHRDAFVAYLEGYAARSRVPVRSGVTVTAVEAQPDGGFIVRTNGGDPIRAAAVVVAAGMQRDARIPAASSGIPASVLQIHALGYRNPAQLPAGAVLVVGSAQSGGQIVEDLLDAGRTVHLATSRVGRVPRRYRGRDIVAWLNDVGFMAHTIATLPNPAMQSAPWPIISGLGRHGHTLSLQFLAERGAHLLGRVASADGGRVLFDDDLGANIAWGDARSAEMAALIDGWISRNGLDAPPQDPDPADRPHPDPASVHSPDHLDLAAEGISTIVWTTGVTGSFTWLPPAAVSGDGHPIHADGVSSVPGLYFVGLPWLRNRASGIIHGVDADAAFLAERLTQDLAAR